MQITFLGATKTVTGSNFLVEGAGKKFLIVDYIKVEVKKKKKMMSHFYMTQKK